MSDFSRRPQIRAREAGLQDGRFHRRLPDADEGSGRRTLAGVIARAQCGDRDALADLYRRYADNVYGFVASIVHDEHDAEDVTQQVFAKLMSVLAKYEQREVPFLAWILAVSRNVAIEHLRRRRPILCDDLEEPDPWGRSPDPLESVSLHDALRALPAEQREVIVLRHVVGLSPGEIAGRMGRTEASVHGLHHRGRCAMRLALRQLGTAPAVMAG